MLLPRGDHPPGLQLCDEPRVARAGLGLIQLADDLAEGLGAGDHRGHMRPALGLIAVQQRLAVAAAQHMGELPRQVGGVAHPGAQALPKEGRCLVRGVAGNQHTALTPASADHRVEPVDGAAPEVEIVGVGKILQHLAQVVRALERGEILIRQDLDFPPFQVSRSYHQRAGAGRTAILPALRRDIRLTQLQPVDHHPPFVEFEVDPLQPQRSADRAAGAVAAHQIGAGRRPRRAFRPGEFHRHSVAVLQEVVGAPAEGGLHGLPRIQPPTQHALELRLDEGQVRRPTQREGRRVRVEHLDDLAVHSGEIGAGMGRGGWKELLGHASELQDTHHLPVQRDRAGLVVDVLVLVDNEDADAFLAQKVRKSRACGAAAGDDDVVICVHGALSGHGGDDGRPGSAGGASRCRNHCHSGCGPRCGHASCSARHWSVTGRDGGRTR